MAAVDAVAMEGLLQVESARRARDNGRLPVEPTVLVLTLSAIQLARDVVALLRERSAAPEIHVLISRRRQAK
jgi:hypothetical protein